jgi:hypothetical protein
MNPNMIAHECLCKQVSDKRLVNQNTDHCGDADLPFRFRLVIQVVKFANPSTKHSSRAVIKN